MQFLFVPPHGQVSNFQTVGSVFCRIIRLRLGAVRKEAFQERLPVFPGELRDIALLRGRLRLLWNRPRLQGVFHPIDTQGDDAPDIHRLPEAGAHHSYILPHRVRAEHRGVKDLLLLLPFPVNILQLAPEGLAGAQLFHVHPGYVRPEAEGREDDIGISPLRLPLDDLGQAWLQLRLRLQITGIKGLPGVVVFQTE